MGATLRTTFYCVVMLLLLRLVGPPLFRFFRMYVWPYLVMFARWWWKRQLEQQEARRRRMAAQSPAPHVIPPASVNDGGPLPPYDVRARVVVEQERKERYVIERY